MFMDVIEGNMKKWRACEKKAPENHYSTPRQFIIKIQLVM